MLGSRARSADKPETILTGQPMSPFQLGLAARLALAGAAAGVLWLAVLWAMS